ncbi:heat shock protein sti1-like protein [Anaeramoeba flamelloides]|uniref:Heat shock protein sti1-like protein n=1 Tax=Anaeramoeba flamelloides TaxID=1746091 RepID=A0AAV7ZEQ8_9EUKA|nr:heat shock protein sti1-like protein [Anaeramoeba flamelloides]
MNEKAERLKKEGTEFWRQKNYQKAADKFEEAIKFAPNNHVLYSNCSGAYSAMKNYEKALEFAEKCVEINPNWYKSHSRKATALFYLNKYKKAIESYEKGIELDPNNKQMKTDLEKCNNALKRQKQQAQQQMYQMQQMFQILYTEKIWALIEGNKKTAPYMEDNNFVEMIKQIQKDQNAMQQYISDPRLMDVIGLIMGIDPNMRPQQPPQPKTQPKKHSDEKPNDEEQEQEQEQEQEKEQEKEQEQEQEQEQQQQQTKENKIEKPKENVNKNVNENENEKEKEKGSLEEKEKENKKDTKNKKKKDKEKEKEIKTAVKQNLKKEIGVEININKSNEFKSQGNKYFLKKKFSEALILYDKAIEYNPNNILLYNNKAAAYIEMGEFETAYKQCETAIGIGRKTRATYEDVAKVYSRMGNGYKRQGNLKKSIEMYKKALTEHRSAPILKLLRITEKEKEEKDRLEYIDPEKAIEAKNEGNRHFKNNDFPEAIKYYTEAIKRDPKNPIYYSNRAAAYTKLGSIPQAEKDCDYILENLDPKFVKAYTRKGFLYLLKKQYNKAMKIYQDALEIDPKNKEASNGLTKTIKAIQLEQQKSRNGEVDEEKIKRAMSDPEIREILSDPLFQKIMEDINNNPRAREKHLQDPIVRDKISKLMAAGVINY